MRQGLDSWSSPASSKGPGGPSSPALRELGGYDLLEEIARGGMGVVWRARQRHLGRFVAVKLIREGLLARPEEIARFQTEAAAVARLQHPGVVAVHEVGEIEGRHYYSMDLIEGASLAEELRRGPLVPARAAALVRQVAEAVEHAHSRGVIHRDLKPANILLDTDGRPRVTDFGLAKLLNSDSDLTLAGAVLGSPHYMAPEQARGRPADARSDVYSLGGILYECLTGHPPFNAANPLDTMKLVIEQAPPPPRTVNPTLPRNLETIALRCLAKEPESRYASAQALAEDLGRFERGEPILARPAGLIERAWRWSRREPAFAALIVLILAVPLGIILLQYRNQDVLRKERDRSNAATQRAERSEALTRENLYAADIGLAWEAYHDGDVAQARTLLNRHLSTDLRFEGGLLSRLVSDSQQLLWKSTNRFIVSQFTASDAPITALTERAIFSLQRANSGLRTSVVLLSSANLNLPPLAVGSDSARNRIVLSDQAALYLINPSLASPKRLAVGRFERLEVRNEDGRVAAATTLGTNQIVRLFDPEGALQVLERPFPTVCALAWEPRLGPLWIATRDGDIWRWDIERGECARRLRDPQVVRGTAFSPDFSQVARATPLFLLIHEMTSGKSLARISLAVDEDVRLSWSPDGKYLAVSDVAGTIQVCTSQEGKVFRRCQGHLGPIAGMGWLTSNTLISTGTDGTVRRWEMQRQFEPLAKIRFDSTASAIFSGDGKRLAIGSRQIPLTLWDTAEGLQLHEYPAAPPSALSQTGERLLARYESTVRFFHSNPARGEVDSSTAFQDLTSSARGAFRLSEDGRTFITQATNGALHLFDAQSGRWLAASPPEVQAFATGPEGRQFALANSGETLWWDGRSGAKHVLSGHSATALAVDKAAARIAIGHAQGLVEVWDAKSRTLIQSFEAHVGAVRSLAFTTDARTLASGGDDRIVRLWHPELGRQLALVTQVLRMHLLVFSPQGDILFGGGPDGCRVWRAPLNNPNIPQPYRPDSGTFWESPNRIEALRLPESRQ